MISVFYPENGVGFSARGQDECDFLGRAHALHHGFKDAPIEVKLRVFAPRSDVYNGRPDLIIWLYEL